MTIKEVYEKWCDIPIIMGDSVKMAEYIYDSWQAIKEEVERQDQEVIDDSQ